MLATLANLGYEVEWRVVNAADYGFPQKRRRVLLIGRHVGTIEQDPNDVSTTGRWRVRLPVAAGPVLSMVADIHHRRTPADVSESFGATKGVSPFRNAGYMSQRRVWTLDLEPAWDGPVTDTRATSSSRRRRSGAVLHPDGRTPDAGSTSRAPSESSADHKGSDTPYFYVEGPIPYPDRTDWPARTILTGEGGRTPSRFKHLVQVEDGRYRRLTPRELERLNGFPDDWTDTGMPEGRRAFMMGNALVVGLIERVGRRADGGSGRRHGMTAAVRLRRHRPFRRSRDERREDLRPLAACSPRCAACDRSDNGRR